MTCQDILGALYELIDCEECDRRSDLIGAGPAPGPDACVHTLMVKHAATYARCTDALDTKRHVRASLRGCYESKQASDALCTRVVASITSVLVIWR